MNCRRMTEGACISRFIQRARCAGAALTLLCIAVVSVAEPIPCAVSGIVGGKVQQVGFRALILKQAIRRNLAGTARNLEDGTVQFVLQGDSRRVDDAIEELRKGTEKSRDVRIVVTPNAFDSVLDSFRVIGWTSASRGIATPRDLVFVLRADDSVVTQAEAQRVYSRILRDSSPAAQ